MAGFDGKVALVTGAGGMQGVGRAIVLKLARQGADVVITDVRRDVEDLPPWEIKAGWRSLDSVSEEVKALGRRCLAVYCDLGHQEQIEVAVQQAIDYFSQVDILVNNARAIIGRDRVPVTELSRQVWDHFLNINTTAPFLLTKLVGQEMVRRSQGGRIINIGSNAGRQASANGAAYSASKFALIGLTQASALDLAPYQITVNCVCPGPINTNRLSYWERERAAEMDIPLEDFRAKIVEGMAHSAPLGRIAEPEDVANLVSFLASDEASFITGQAYNVNGGLLFH